MKRYLFDTSAISLMLEGNVPDKWKRFWIDVRTGRGRLILFEPLVSETYYKNVQVHGKKPSKRNVLWLKALPETTMVHLDDNHAIAAGDIKVEHSRFSLSLVDCFILAVAKSQSAKIITMDHSLRDVARKMRIGCSFLPLAK